MKQFAVIGDPIEHSLSPRIHTLFAAQAGIDLEYRKLRVHATELQRDIETFFTNGGTGLNITVPHKQTVFKLCKSLTPRAQLAGAVNTLYLEDGKLAGDNTDGVGLVRDISNNLRVTCRNSKLLIIGAGGASRGILEPLLALSPGSIDIANRTHSKAVELVSLFQHLGKIRALSFSELSIEYDVVVNASSSSLQDDIPAIPEHCLTKSELAYDLMYASTATPFMAFAAQAGAQQQSDGLGMLVEQAAEAFSIWHGYKPETQSVIASLRSLH
ncbi:MAG: shikimate dehydrogenase [Proteobacteria bacterium]|jgi:shikimate dehydrogenase|nr:shikimate dehydrogenase [Pseudomonadota bacterium]